MEQLNESQETDLLMNMYNFYKKRYANDQTTMEKKFNTACEDLISTGDISKKEYMSFCVTHDIEPVVAEITKKITTSSSSSSSVDSCGRTTSRGGC